MADGLWRRVKSCFEFLPIHHIAANIGGTDRNVLSHTRGFVINNDNLMAGRQERIGKV